MLFNDLKWWSSWKFFVITSFLTATPFPTHVLHMLRVVIVGRAGSKRSSGGGFYFLVRAIFISERAWLCHKAFQRDSTPWCSEMAPPTQGQWRVLCCRTVCRPWCNRTVSEYPQCCRTITAWTFVRATTLLWSPAAPPSRDPSRSTWVMVSSTWTSLPTRLHTRWGW